MGLLPLLPDKDEDVVIDHFVAHRALEALRTTK